MENKLLITIPGNFFSWNATTMTGTAVASKLPALSEALMVESHKTGKCKAFFLTETVAIETKSREQIIVARTYESCDGVVLNVISD